MRRPANVINERDVEWSEKSHSGRFGFRRRQLAAATGASKLGCSLYEIGPGRTSFPHHYHCANEEAIFVLEGSASLRLASGEVPIGPGDYVTLPVGAGGAHQVVNRSNAPVRYLCLSTMIEPEVSVYPDSDKVGFFAGSAPGGALEKRTIEGFVPLAARVDYFYGED
ncbi:MAG TPA: cupin domain-containing protein [Candidatus Polarisedimenticolia bacterium]|nr:cupin domain-containing protein [Candidatus Polarisedimenticolia bacterium]